MEPEGPRRLAAEAALALHLSLADPQLGSLLRYAELLRTRAVALGLISGGDQGRILARHVLDSLRAATVVRPEDRRAYDLGSGAGLPGIAVAIACPALAVEAVESRRTRAAFLELVADELALSNVTVRWARVEELGEPANLCFARAFAPVARSWDAANRLLVPGGALVYFAGQAEEAPAGLPGAASVELRSAPLLDSRGALAIIRS